MAVITTFHTIFLEGKANVNNRKNSSAEKKPCSRGESKNSHARYGANAAMIGTKNKENI